MRIAIYLWKKLLVLRAVFVFISYLAALTYAFVQRLFGKCTAPLHVVIGRWYPRWKGISHVNRGVIVGILIAIATAVFHDTDTFRKVEDGALDWMIQMYRGVPRPTTSQLRPVTFIDIDEPTYRAWGEPLYIPRDKLQTLISYSVDGKASIIMVDVELSRLSGAPDEALASYLDNVAKHNHEFPEIILARGLRLPYGDKSSLIEQRPSFLDDVVSSNPHIHWASPLYEMDDDAVVRRWRLWEPTCIYNQKGNADPHVAGLPSFQLLAAALLYAPNAESTLNETMRSYLPERCDDIHKPSVGGVETVSLNGLRFKLNEKDINRRILYSLPAHLSGGETYPLTRLGDGSEYPVLTIKPARVIAEAAHSAPGSLDGHIVIIGSSFADSRDNYNTPLGPMPGAMIIANSYLSFVQNGEATTPPLWAKLLIELVLIVTVAYVFAMLKGRPAKVAASFLTLVILLPLSFWLFRSGVWLDFAIPLLVVEFHAVWGEIEDTADRQIPQELA